MSLSMMFDNIFDGYFTILLNVLSFIAIIFATLVITIKNPIISILYLIGLFVSIACYLISIGLTYIGISYLLVYVGAVSILFLFILMLINVRISELTNETRNSLPLIIIVALVFSIYNVIFPQENLPGDGFINTDNYILNNIAYNNWENNLNEFYHINSIANIMYTSYSIWLIVACIILLLAMVGAIVITVKQKAIIEEHKTL